jgi:hypothetical protein
MSLLSDDEKVQHLQQRWAEGALDLQAFERLLIDVMDSGAWQSFRTPNGLAVNPTSFREFVMAQPFQGLGTTKEKIEAHLGEDNAAVVKLRKLWKGSTDPRQSSTNNVSRATKQGNRRDYTLERLERERPDLRERVDARELSPNAAAIQAGFRPRTFTVRADDPEKIAATLRRQLPEDVLKRVINHLEGW